MVWVLAWRYLRVADREFEPLEHRVQELAARGEAGR